MWEHGFESRWGQKLMYTLLLTIIAGIFQGIGDFLVKLSSNKISPQIGAIVLLISATIPPTAYFLITKNFKGAMITKQGLALSILAGIFIGIGVTIFYIVFSRGGLLSVISPVTRTSIIVVSFLLGLIFLHEQLVLTKIIGFILAISGIFFLFR